MSIQNCEVCCEVKQARNPFQQSNTRTVGLLDIIHTDIAGPLKTTSIGGSKYYMKFQDDFRRMSFVFFLKSTHEVFEKFMDFQSLVEKQVGKKIKVLRSDNGGEFANKIFETYLKNKL